MVPVFYEIMGGVWSLRTSRGHWSVRSIFEWMDLDHMENAFRLREAAIAAGVMVPQPVLSASGRAMETVGGTKWCVDEWIDVGPTPAKPAWG